MKNSNKVLISWVAVNNDPFEQNISTGDFRLVEGKSVPGPTMTVLFDEESPYLNQIHDIVLLHMQSDEHANSRGQRAITETVDAIREKNPKIRIQIEQCRGDDARQFARAKRVRWPNRRKLLSM
ncbi:hypothetical protein [Desulfonatronum parangueonense]